MVRTALVQNYDLRDAVVRVEAARANLGITRADQFPTVEAGASVTTVRSSASGTFPLPEGVDQTRTFGTRRRSIFSRSKWMSGAGCAARPKPHGRICSRPKRTARQSSRRW